MSESPSPGYRQRFHHAIAVLALEVISVEVKTNEQLARKGEDDQKFLNSSKRPNTSECSQVFGSYIEV